MRPHGYRRNEFVVTLVFGLTCIYICIYIYIYTHIFSLFSCKTCGKQYTTKTPDRFRYRCNIYKMEAGKAESGDTEIVKQKFLQIYLLQDHHKCFLKDVEVRLINKTQDFDPTKPE